MLCGIEYNVCFLFVWRGKQCKIQDIGSYSYFVVGCMCFFGKFLVVFCIIVCIRILQDVGKEVICKFKILEFFGMDFNVLWDGVSGDDC